MNVAMNVPKNLDLSTLDAVNLLAMCKRAKIGQKQVGNLLGVSQATVCNVKHERAEFTPQQLQTLRQFVVELRVNHPTSAASALKVVDETFVMPEVKQAPPETHEEMSERINQIFTDLTGLVAAVGTQALNALLIDGGAGVGKSHTVTTVLNSLGIEYTLVKGTGSAPFLYRKLFQNRESVLVLDDADDFIRDETCLNLLKAALDTTDGPRIISYGKLAPWMEAEDIPDSFEFVGSVIVISNLQLDIIAQGKGKLAPHIEALLSRSLHCAMEMNTREEVLCRIEMIADDVLEGLSSAKKKQVLNFFVDNMMDFKQFSIRELVKLQKIVNLPNWEALARRGLLKSKKGGR